MADRTRLRRTTERQTVGTDIQIGVTHVSALSSGLDRTRRRMFPGESEASDESQKAE